MTHKKILFSSVCRPFGERYGDAFTTTTQALHQLMWAQGIFRIEDHAYHWGLDVIAANIQTPSKVLHYPSIKELKRELCKGYDYLGISFVPPTFHKLQAMIPEIRKAAPNTKIILGGYGTCLSDEELAPYGDIICRKEGISFMRELLGEPEAPFKTPPVFFQSNLFSINLLGKSGVVFGGVGCPHGCDFCMTSHYFKRKHIRFLKNGEEILNSIQTLQRHKPEVDSFVIYDEDFLLNKKRGRSFLEAIRKTDTRATVTIFGSVKAVSQYDPEELLEMGVSAIWMGFEGMRSGYDKMKGADFKTLVEDLRQVGISAALSMIIGFDYQDLNIIEEEFNELLSIRPDVSQFLLYGPSRGTPLYHKLKDEQRLTDICTNLYPMQDGTSLGFRHPHISAPTLEETLRNCYRKEYSALGPTVFRTIETQLTGYNNIKNSTKPRLRIRAEMMRKFLLNAHAAFRVGERFAPNNTVKTRIQNLERRLIEDVAAPGPMQRVQSYMALGLGAWTSLRFRNHLLDQPHLVVNQYR